jgi:hypothetical protein
MDARYLGSFPPPYLRFKAMTHCLGVVHNTQSNDGMEKFYKNFDAYYNPATGRVVNNAQTYGDSKAVFVFNKCMAKQGFFFKPEQK